MFHHTSTARLLSHSLRRTFFGPPTKTAGPLHIKVLEQSKHRFDDLGVSSSVIGTSTATIAAGCFWGIELAYQRVPGITRTAVGYTAGHDPSPTYEKVCTGTSGHTEAVQLTFDPRVVTFEDLLVIFWDIHDGTQLNRQGGDVGTQYRSGIYWHDMEQRDQAERMHKTISSQLMETIGMPLATEIVKCETFFNAEEQHQKYLERGGQDAKKMCRNPIRCYG